MSLSISVGSKVSRVSATVAMRCLLSVGYYPQGYKQCTPAAHSATAAGVPLRPPCALATRLPPTHFNHRWQWEAWHRATWHRATAPPQRGLASPGMRDQLRRSVVGPSVRGGQAASVIGASRDRRWGRGRSSRSVAVNLQSKAVGGVSRRSKAARWASIALVGSDCGNQPPAVPAPAGPRQRGREEEHITQYRAAAVVTTNFRWRPLTMRQSVPPW